MTQRSRNSFPQEDPACASQERMEVLRTEWVSWSVAVDVGS